MSIQTPYIELTSLDIDNHIINGGMNFFTRFGGAPQPASAPTGYGYSAADRFFTQLQNVTTVAYTIGQSFDIPTVSQVGTVLDGSQIITVTTSDSVTNPNATIIPFGYRMEGLDYARLHGRTATLSFWVKTNKPGQYSVAFHSASQLRSYVSDFIINNSGTWEQKFITVQFESVISGDYSFSNAMGLEIVFCAFSGSNFVSSTQNQWTFDAVYEKNNSNLSQNIFDTNGNTIQFAAIKLNLGPIASPFTIAGRGYAEEQRLVQRYFVYSSQWWVNGSGESDFVGRFPVPMRTSPSPFVVNGSLNYNILGIGAGACSYQSTIDSGPTGAIIRCTGFTGSPTTGNLLAITNEGGIGWDAEL